MKYIKTEEGQGNIRLKGVNSKYFGSGKECKSIRKTQKEYKFIRSNNTLDNRDKGRKVK